MGFSVLKGEQLYARMHPKIFNLRSESEDLADYFSSKIQEQHAICPPEGYFTFENVHICDGKYIRDNTGAWISESIVDLGSSDIILQSVNKVLDEGHHVVAAFSHENRPVVCLAKAGAGNYGHFITEIAPKLIYLKKLNIPNAVLILPDECLRFGEILTATFYALDLKLELLFVKAGSLYFVQTLIFIANVSKHDYRKSPTLLEWRESILSKIVDTPLSQRKLFITRARGEKRNFTNIGELEAALATYGFEAVDPGGLSFTQQIKLFQSASHIIGGLGAGLTNILFCEPDTKIFMISPGLMDFFFWDISCLIRQEFNWFFAGALQFYNIDLAEADYTVPVPKLVQALVDARWIA